MIKRYLLTVFLLMGFGSAATMGFNWLMDPMGMYSPPLISGVNVVKPMIYAYDREIKAWSIQKHKPDGLILGSSRTSVGLDPEHEAWSADTVYNASLSAITPYGIYRYFQHAQGVAPIKQVVVGMDFFGFNAEVAGGPKFDESLLVVGRDGASSQGFPWSRHLQSLLSWTVFDVSLTALRINRKPEYKTLDADTYERDVAQNGVTSPDHFLSQSWKTFREKAYGTLRVYLFSLWGDEDSYAATDDQTISDAAHWYRMMLRDAYATNVDMRIIINPSHAYLLEALHAYGLWLPFEDWKRLLVRVNEEEAALAGKAAFPIFDFSGYSSYTTEVAYAETDEAYAFKYFWDPGHYRLELGTKVLDRVFQPEDVVSSDGFGALLTSTTVEDHIAAIRDQRKLYRESRPEEIQELDEVLAGLVVTARAKRAPAPPAD